MTFQLFSQWPGEAGTFQTVWQMKGLVNKNIAHPWIRERAALLTEGCGRSASCEHETLQNGVVSLIRYLRDPSSIEALHDPVSFYEARLISGRSAYGDCDDMAIYLATLLKSIGHRPSFKIVGKKGPLHHVLIFCDNENLDPTMGLGNFPRNPARSVLVPI